MYNCTYFLGVDAGVNGGAVLVACNDPEPVAMWPDVSSRLIGGRDDKIGIEYSVRGAPPAPLSTEGTAVYCDIIGSISRGAVSAEECSYIVSQWLTLYAIRLACIERVGIVQKQAKNEVLLRSFGWWEGLLSASRIPYITVRPSRWKRWAGVPPAKRGAGRAEIKGLAVARAQELFPLVNFYGKRGGVTVNDWKAEAAMLALCARQAAVTVGR